MDAVVNIQRMLILKSALKLEVLGMKRSRRPSAYSAIKSEWNLKGNKERVLNQFTVIVEEAQADWHDNGDPFKRISIDYLTR